MTPALSDPKQVRRASGPNILYILMEDCGPDFACYGQPLAQTPCVDRLAAEGVRFTHAFCTAPVCSASRSAIMTGAYQTYTGCHHHRTWPWRKKPLPSPIRHVCDWFRAAGYFTCNLQPAPEKWAQIRAGNGITGAAGNGKNDLNFIVTSPRPDDPFDGIDWTERPAGQPFFAHITIMETHKGAGWREARGRAGVELANPAEIKLPPYFPDHPVARDEYANYLDAIGLADGFIGELLDRLRREGLAGDTIVMLSGDHGALFRGKQFLYDDGLRVPLVVRFPDGSRAGTVDDRLVSGIDFAPTLLGFAGITPAADAMHGYDLFAERSPPRQEIYAARDRMDTAIDRMRAVRDRRFKYIRNYFPAIPYMQANPYKEKEYPTWNLVKSLQRQGRLSPAAALFAADTKPMEELYDVIADPFEIRNLAGERALAPVLELLRAKMDGWVARFDHGAAGEDPLEIYRGFWNRQP